MKASITLNKWHFWHLPGSTALVYSTSHLEEYQHLLPSLGALQDLNDVNVPVSDAMSKSMLISSRVEDRDYSHILNILIASSDNFEMCMTRLLDKHNMMNSG